MKRLEKLSKGLFNNARKVVDGSNKSTHRGFGNYLTTDNMISHAVDVMAQFVGNSDDRLINEINGIKENVYDKGKEALFKLAQDIGKISMEIFRVIRECVGNINKVFVAIEQTIDSILEGVGIDKEKGKNIKQQIFERILPTEMKKRFEDDINQTCSNKQGLNIIAELLIMCVAAHFGINPIIIGAFINVLSEICSSYNQTKEHIDTNLSSDKIKEIVSEAVRDNKADLVDISDKDITKLENELSKRLADKVAPILREGVSKDNKVEILGDLKEQLSSVLKEVGIRIKTSNSNGHSLGV